MEGGQKGACKLKTGLDLAPNLGAPTSEHLLHLHNSMHFMREKYCFNIFIRVYHKACPTNLKPQI